MCGILGAVAGPEWDRALHRALDSIAHRGPDARGHVRRGDVFLGHVRLSVIDLSSASDQPFVRGDVALAFNGEIWNFREVRAELESMGHAFRTAGDTEVVAAALEQWGPSALDRLEGMFAIAWHDGRDLHLARDRFGEVPLHAAVQAPFVFGSELKALRSFGASPSSVRWVGPGEVWTLSGGRLSTRRWWRPGAFEGPSDRAQAAEAVRVAFDASCDERTIADAPACFLLSGGIDSAAVVGAMRNSLPGAPAYTAVLNQKSPDLRAAREVAEAAGVDLVEVPVPVPTSSELASVIERIEMPHKAQVEIGWACLHLARRIQADGFKVTFSGEGSDELWASYGFAYHGISQKGWRRFREELFLGQHRKNFARCNKVFMAHSVECRLPFLNADLVELALSLPREAVAAKGRPKAVFQDAVADLVPDRVVRRQKLAFQDGLGLKTAIASLLADPKVVYAGQFQQAFHGVKA